MRKEQFDNRLGETVKSARLAKGWTQAQLSETLGITPRYLKYIENGGRKPSLNLLERIIGELDIPSDKFFQPKNEISQPKIYILQGVKSPG
jgi:transcriptional regulator with XRE-family HTH domain